MLAPMFALLRKDRPWIVVFAVAGLLTALGAVLFERPTYLLLFDYATAEATFWTALGGGLAVGAFAAVFDELLGTRELLWQRPVGARTLAVSRLGAVALVLFVWQLAIPLVLALWWPFADVEGLEFALGSWLEQQAAVVVAWPCAMAMVFAGSLPLGWLPRLVVGGASFYLAMLVVAGNGVFDTQQIGAYVAACLLVAVGFAALALAATLRRADPDRPLATEVPAWQRWAVIAAVTLVGAAVAIEWECQWLHELQRNYPRPYVQAGSTVVRLVAPGDGEQRVVDAQHQPLAEAVIAGKDVPWPGGFPWLHPGNEFGQPGWISRRREAGSPFTHAVHLGSNGLAWLERRTKVDRRGWRTSFTRLGVDGEVRFARTATVTALDGAMLVAERGRSEVWRLDAAAGRLVAVLLPDGDRVQSVRPVRLSGRELTAADWQQWQELVAREAARVAGVASGRPSSASEVLCVLGDRGTYALVGESLRAFPAEPMAPIRASLDPAAAMASGGELGPDDPMTFRRSLPATSDHVAFVHEFEPRTPKERAAAAFAIGCSSLRPPVLQVLAHMAPATARPLWLFDGLVVDGRRTWLLLLQCAFSGLLAFQARRWLVRHGVPATAWTWQIALFGVPAALLFVYFERPRRVVMRDVSAPAPLRIGALSAASAAP